MRSTRHTSATRATLALLASGFVLAPTPVHAKPAHGKTTKPRTPKPGTPPGGANQVQGLNGKIGDVLFDGHWRFQVLSVQPASTYTLAVPSSEQDYSKYHDVAEYADDTHTFTPKAGYTFFVVKCHVKNGQKRTEQIDGYLNDPKTALADDKENSYSPIAYDMYSKGAWVTKELLPGSGEDLTLLFAVPPGTTPKDLVFTLKNWSDHQGHNVRVSLSP